MLIEIYTIIDYIIKFMAIFGHLTIQYITHIKKLYYGQLDNASNLINEYSMRIRY